MGIPGHGDGNIGNDMSGRIRNIPSVAGVELHILAKKEWGSLIFLPVWLTAWAFGLVLATKWILHPEPNTPRALISLWLLGWLLGGLWAVYQWLWTAFGKEVVQVKEESLNVKRDVLGFGRSRSFPIGSIANLRASGIFPSNSYWLNHFTRTTLGGSTVAFDHRDKISRFGIQLTEPEAQEAVRELKPWLPS